MDELDLVRLVRPEVADPSETLTSAARHRVLESVSVVDRHPRRGWLESRWGRGVRSPRWAVSVPIAAAVLAVVLMLVVIVPSTAPSAAAEVLLAVADRAEAETTAVTTTVPVGGTATDMPGIRYTRWESASLVTFSVGIDQSYSAIVRTTRDMWVAPDGSGRIAETVQDVEFLSEEDRMGWERLDGDLHLAINEEFGPGGLIYEDYGSLPTDPEQLEAVLARIPHGNWPDEVGLFWSVQDLLRDGGTPPGLRAALYRVVAGIEGIELLGEVTDRAGRPGTGVALTYDRNGLEYQEWLIFDPDTTVLLGEENVLLTATPEYRAEPPITVSWFVYLESDRVDQIP